MLISMVGYVGVLSAHVIMMIWYVHYHDDDNHNHDLSEQRDMTGWNICHIVHWAEIRIMNWTGSPIKIFDKWMRNTQFLRQSLKEEHTVLKTALENFELDDKCHSYCNARERPFMKILRWESFAIFTKLSSAASAAPRFHRDQFYCLPPCYEGEIFSCPKQLDRWPCH